jgi:Protein of unknown function (DUF3987)
MKNPSYVKPGQEQLLADLTERFGGAAYPPFPELSPTALYGLPGELVRAIGPHTEADPAAVLTHLLVAFGNLVGASPYFEVSGARHGVRLFACIVGKTSKGRKGSSWAYVRRVLGQVDETWLKNCQGKGLSSGEGLIHAVRDPVRKLEEIKEKGKRTGRFEEVLDDPGVEDKRLFVIEEEFARVLKVTQQERNILSTVLRSAWDTGDLRTLTKGSPDKATGAHISVIGHITEEELRQGLAENEFFNGFANRFDWVCAKRSKCLPEGGSLNLEELAPSIKALTEAARWAAQVEEMERDAQARELWISVYSALSAEISGRFGAATSRAEAQVLRLSMVYALADHSRIISVEHLKAALAFWKYANDSARYLFGKQALSGHAIKALTYLRTHPEGVPRNELTNEVFQRNHTKQQIDEALEPLRSLGLAYPQSEETPGRPIERWFSTNGLDGTK